MSNVLKIDVPGPEDPVYGDSIVLALEEADKKIDKFDIFSGSVIEVDEGKYASDPDYYDDAKNVLTEWKTKLENNSIWGDGYLSQVDAFLGKTRPDAAVPGAPEAPVVQTPPEPAPTSTRKASQVTSPYVLKMVFPLGQNTAGDVEGFDKTAIGDDTGRFFEFTLVDGKALCNLSIDLGLFFVDKAYNEQCRKFAKSVFDMVNGKVSGAADNPALITDTNQRNFFMTAKALKDYDLAAKPEEAVLELVFPMGPVTANTIYDLDDKKPYFFRFDANAEEARPLCELTVDLRQLDSNPEYVAVFREFAAKAADYVNEKVSGAADNPDLITDTNQRNFFTTVSALQNFIPPAVEVLLNSPMNYSNGYSTISFQYDTDEWTNDDATLTAERTKDGMILTLTLAPEELDWGPFDSNPIEEEWERGTWKIYVDSDGGISDVTFQTKEEIWDDTTRYVALTSNNKNRGTFEQSPEYSIGKTDSFFIDDSGLYTIDDPTKPPFKKSPAEVYRRLAAILTQSPAMTAPEGITNPNLKNNKVLLDVVTHNLEAWALYAEGKNYENKYFSDLPANAVDTSILLKTWEKETPQPTEEDGGRDGEDTGE
ncbi:MAG: hypothetical protein HY541_00425 [Deltaproteobacteria bacterium]|nr:hypothetical protein [Deltaproteobacteria bacterium]